MESRGCRAANDLKFNFTKFSSLFSAKILKLELENYKFDTMAYTFVKSQRGKSKLVYEGFVYVHQRTRGTSHYFKCEVDTCPGRAILKGVPKFDQMGGAVSMGRCHDHEPEEGREVILKSVENIRQSGRNTLSNPASIIQENLTTIPKKFANNIPSENSLSQIVRRQRRRDFPPQPTARQGIEIPDSLQSTVEGEDFIIFDSGATFENDRRIIALGTVTNFDATYVRGAMPARKRGRPKKGLNITQSPRFPPEIWSVHDLQVVGYGRTNNKQEGWHRRFESVLQRYHIGVYPFIRECKREQHRTEVQIERIDSRNRRPSRPRVVQQREDRLQKAFEEYGAVPHLRFIRRIARNLTFRSAGQVASKV